MFKNAIRLPFKLLGIPVYLDITFLIILPVLAWIIGRQIDIFVTLASLPIETTQITPGWTPYFLGLVAALGLFISVVIHELGHAITARFYKVETERIILWLLGGMAQFKEMPKQRGGEAVVAIAGPITSFILAVIGWGILQFIPTAWAATYFVVAYIAYINVAVAVFNLIPALPLDGGRVLRSLLALRMSHLQATEVSGSISRFIAILLGIFGFLAFNIFIMLIAFFIYMAVTAETRYSVVDHVLRDIPISRLMTREISSVLPDMPLRELMAKMMEEARLGYPVVDETNRIVGYIHLKDIQNNNQNAHVGDLMSADLHTISVNASAFEAFEVMTKNNYATLLVVDHDANMVGIVSKTDLMRAIEVQVAGMNATRTPPVRATKPIAT